MHTFYRNWRNSELTSQNDIQTERSPITLLYSLPTKAPKDSLDFHLKSTYDHHQEFLSSKNQTLYQRETFTDDHGWVWWNWGGMLNFGAAVVESSGQKYCTI